MSSEMTMVWNGKRSDVFKIMRDGEIIGVLSRSELDKRDSINVRTDQQSRKYMFVMGMCAGCILFSSSVLFLSSIGVLN
jgi:hypothetical protein